MYLVRDGRKSSSSKQNIFSNINLIGLVKKKGSKNNIKKYFNE